MRRDEDTTLNAFILPTIESGRALSPELIRETIFSLGKEGLTFFSGGWC